jgi:hypothetical protein
LAESICRKLLAQAFSERVVRALMKLGTVTAKMKAVIADIRKINILIRRVIRLIFSKYQANGNQVTLKRWFRGREVFGLENRSIRRDLKKSALGQKSC